MEFLIDLLFVDCFATLSHWGFSVNKWTNSRTRDLLSISINTHARKQFNVPSCMAKWKRKYDDNGDNDNNNTHLKFKQRGTTRAKDVSRVSPRSLFCVCVFFFIVIAVVSFQIQIFIVVLTHFKLICTYWSCFFSLSLSADRCVCVCLCVDD